MYVENTCCTQIVWRGFKPKLLSTTCLGSFDGPRRFAVVLESSTKIYPERFDLLEALVLNRVVLTSGFNVPSVAEKVTRYGRHLWR